MRHINLQTPSPIQRQHTSTGKPRLSAGLFACCLFGLTLTAPAQIILSDSFSRNVNNPPQAGGPSGWGANDNALGGTQTQTYLAQLDPTTSQQQWVNGSQGLLRSGSTRIDLDLAPLAPSGFTLSFDATRGVGGYVGFTLGLGPTNTLAGLAPLNAFADFSFLLKPAVSGSMQLEMLTNGISATGNYGAFGSATAAHSIVAALTPNGYTGTAGISITIDGNNAFTGSLFTGTFDWQNDGWQGYVSFESNNTDAKIDNLVITAVPEPGTVLLGVFGGLGLALFRRDHQRQRSA